MALGLFDIDGTLVEDPSCERRFFAFLRKHGHQPPARWLPHVARTIKGLVTDGPIALKTTKAYLAGMDVQEVEALADEWVAADAAGAFIKGALERLEAHRARGDDIWLLTGTPDFLAAALARHLDVAGYSASDMVAEDGRYTGAPPTRHPYGSVKQDIAVELVREFGIGSEDVVAYGNSIHDEAVLRWAGCAVAVWPDRRLAGVANAENWEIIGGS